MALSDQPEISKKIAYRERGCAVGVFARTLPDRDLATLRSWLADPEATHAAIAAQINTDPDYDVTIKAFVVGRHRRGDCSCGAL